MSAHDHAHSHEHGHSHAVTATPDNRRRLGLALAITAGVMIAEALAAFITGSLSLLTDAAHMLNDTVGLVMALVAAQLMRRPPTAHRTWGWVRVEVLAAGAQAAILLIIGVYALVEGVSRLISPTPVAATGMLIVGVVGLVANALSLMVLAGARGDNLNMKAAFLEVAADTLGSVAVIVSGVVIAFTGWVRADAIAGIFIVCLILPRALSLLKETGSILLESTPAGLDLHQVRHHIEELDHVMGVHDLHASTVATGLPTVTAHVVLSDECFRDGHALETLGRLQDCVATHHGVAIEHSTFQLEDAHTAARHAADCPAITHRHA